jgi:hypothetical protein
MNLLLVIPYCAKDAHLMRPLARWMSFLQAESSRHSCLFAVDDTVSVQDAKEIQHMMDPCFAGSEIMIVRMKPEQQVWPAALNHSFAMAARQVQEAYKLPWLWMEPDATPLKPGWLNEIAGAYETCPKRFMGPLMTARNQPGAPPVHMPACAVYPPDAWKSLEQFTKGPAPFYIASAGYTAPRAQNTRLIQHFWGKPDLPPTFVRSRGPSDPENAVPPDFLRPDAALFHRCKDGSLIDLLSQSDKSAPVNEESETLAEILQETT